MQRLAACRCASGGAHDPQDAPQADPGRLPSGGGVRDPKATSPCLVFVPKARLESVAGVHRSAPSPAVSLHDACGAALTSTHQEGCPAWAQVDGAPPVLRRAEARRSPGRPGSWRPPPARCYPGWPSSARPSSAPLAVLQPAPGGSCTAARCAVSKVMRTSLGTSQACVGARDREVVTGTGQALRCARHTQRLGGGAFEHISSTAPQLTAQALAVMHLMSPPAHPLACPPAHICRHPCPQPRPPAPRRAARCAGWQRLGTAAHQPAGSSA